MKTLLIILFFAAIILFAYYMTIILLLVADQYESKEAFKKDLIPFRAAYNALKNSYKKLK